MPIVQLENGQKLQFDDSYTPDQISEAIDEYMSAQLQQPDRQASNNQIGKIESAAVGLGQGATANFSDEIIAGLTTPVIYGAAKVAKMLGKDINGLDQKTLAEIYRAEQQKNQLGIEEAQRANPASYFGGEIAGSIATAAQTLGTKAGQAASQYLGKGSLPVRIAKAAPVSTAVGALAGAGAASPDEISEQAARGAKAGLIFSPVGPIASDAIGALANKFNKKTSLPNSEDIANLSQAAYKEAADLGANLNESFTDKFLNKIESAKPKKIAGKVLTSEDADLIKTIDEFKDLRGSKLTLEDAERIDKALTNKVSAALDNGRPTPKSRVINDIQIDLRNKLFNPEAGDITGGKEGIEAYNKAKNLYAQSAKLRDIETIIARAETTDNPATALKTGFRNLYFNAKKSRGYSEDELKLINRAAKSGKITDLLRTFGSRGIPLITLSSGQGPAATAAAQLGSMASRDLATRLQSKRAEDVLKAIATRGKSSSKEGSTYSFLSAALAPSLAELNIKKNKK